MRFLSFMINNNYLLWYLVCTLSSVQFTASAYKIESCSFTPISGIIPSSCRPWFNSDSGFAGAWHQYQTNSIILFGELCRMTWFQTTKIGWMDLFSGDLTEHWFWLYVKKSYHVMIICSFQFLHWSKLNFTLEITTKKSTK